MPKALQESPIRIMESRRWNTADRRRIFRQREDTLRIQKLDGNTLEMPAFQEQIELTIVPRSFSVEVLEIDHTLKDGTTVPQQVMVDMERFVSRGELGGFVPFRSSIVEPIGISRGIVLTHPLLPGQKIYASGVGVFTRDEGSKRKLTLHEPDPSLTIREYALGKGLATAMSTLILGPDGEQLDGENRAGLGLYRLGSRDDLARPAHGEETLLRKVDNTKTLEREMGDVLTVPHILMFGSYREIPDAGFLFYTLPETISPLEVYKLGKKADEKSGQKQYLYELYAHQFLGVLSQMHDANRFHGQPHMGNWQIVTSRAKYPPLSMTDWGTMVDIAAYPRTTQGSGMPVYDRMKAVDFSSATSAIVSAIYTDTKRFTPSVMEKISELISFCFSGYFSAMNPDIVKIMIQHGFVNESVRWAREQELLGASNLDPVESIDSLMDRFLPNMFYSLARSSGRMQISEFP